MLSQESEEMLVNPFWNGVLICELIAIVQKIQIFDVVYQPWNFQDCQANVERAFSCLKDTVPPALVSNPDNILRGDRTATWGLICKLQELFPDAAP